MKALLLPITISLLLPACATTRVDLARTQAVKRVAVAGFSVPQQVPSGMSVLGNSDDRTVGWGIGIGEPARHSEDMYEALLRTLHKEFRWQVLPQDKLTKNTSYSALYQRVMKGIQNRPPIAAGMHAYGAQGVADAFPLERLSLGERQELLSKLGVDALVAATVTVKLAEGGGLKRLYGGGDYKPYAEIRFSLYDGKTQEAIWTDVAARGETASEGVSHVLGGVADVKTLNRIAVGAAESSYRTLVKRYRK